MIYFYRQDVKKKGIRKKQESFTETPWIYYFPSTHSCVNKLIINETDVVIEIQSISPASKDHDALIGSPAFCVTSEEDRLTSHLPVSIDPPEGNTWEISTSSLSL